MIGYIIDISFFVDMLLTFFQSFYDEENFTRLDNYKAISIRYLKGWFFFDALSVFPFEFIINSQNKVGKSIG